MLAPTEQSEFYSVRDGKLLPCGATAHGPWRLGVRPGPYKALLWQNIYHPAAWRRVSVPEERRRERCARRVLRHGSHSISRSAGGTVCAQ